MGLLIALAVLAALVVWIFQTSRVQPRAAPEAEFSLSHRAGGDSTQTLDIDLQKDAWESAYADDWGDRFPVEVHARIVYVDANGLETKRSIRTIELMHTAAGHAIDAFCELRQQKRTFMISRIKEFVDLATGEIVTDVASTLRETYEATPIGRADLIVGGYASEVQVLCFVARCRGKLSARAKHLVMDYLRGRENTDGVDLDRAELNILRMDPLDQKGFRHELRALAAQPDAAKDAIIAAAREIASFGAKPPLALAAVATMEEMMWGKEHSRKGITAAGAMLLAMLLPQSIVHASPSPADLAALAIASVPTKPAWLPVRVKTVDARNYDFALDYKSIPANIETVEGDSKIIVRAMLKTLTAAGHNPADEWINIHVWAEMPGGTGETGKPLIRVFGMSSYNYNTDRIDFDPMQ